ncbi:hypothetical protein ENSA5_60970 [Enhygromyxa salina]|uniref:Uncharacterized protein n=1 Tax=Enhygromyxa salina TaxID=215803 RepID=A0A2S9XDC1_9BACT|nr:hypothetical protein ENSA5_60970 [Enhygromyxa salina]
MRGRVFILYHPVTPTLERALEEAEAYLELRHHFESMSVFIWLGQPFPPPAPEIRAALAAGFAGGPKVDAVGWVVDSDHSLGASVVHSVSTQMFPGVSCVQLFREPFEAAHWLSVVAKTEAELILDGLDTLDRAQPA